MWPFSSQDIPSYPSSSRNSSGGRKSGKTYDYTVVGGGAAGCCLASRLSEDPSIYVLVLERGRVNNAWYSRLMSSDTTRSSTPIVKSPSLPLEAVYGKRLNVVHAGALGGGSAVNAMLVTRGAVGDFDRWAELGHPSWDYAALRPYFMKSERRASTTPRRIVDTRVHGLTKLSRTSLSKSNRRSRMQHLSEKMDVPYKAHNPSQSYVRDLNSAKAPVDAFATLDATIDSKMCRGRRSRSRVRVRRQFYIRKIICARREGSRRLLRGIRVAQLLLLSGIGPKEHLEYTGIEVVKDVPGVGARLQDRLCVAVLYDVPLEDTLHHIENSTWAGVLTRTRQLLPGAEKHPGSELCWALDLNSTSSPASPDYHGQPLQVPPSVLPHVQLDLRPMYLSCPPLRSQAGSPPLAELNDLSRVGAHAEETGRVDERVRRHTYADVRRAVPTFVGTRRHTLGLSPTWADVRWTGMPTCLDESRYSSAHVGASVPTGPLNAVTIVGKIKNRV
ncbi:hypothetical protein DFH07DRAFT_769108 [Mycena maculata]|uniref:Glucose-methanol-choline oxidoreductase N-terminal domain-containing protein n=1 Tax=Mycena maculata TaxID=230809 RepID=A0AAD7NP76_9AGAR|nr:hypothetical protein DFH07DRAFT_769108 [Mycena maculata]